MTQNLFELVLLILSVWMMRTWVGMGVHQLKRGSFSSDPTNEGNRADTGILEMFPRLRLLLFHQDPTPDVLIQSAAFPRYPV